MKRLFSIVAAASISVCGAPSAQAQEGLSPEEIGATQRIDLINNNMEDLLSSMESYRVRGECDKFRSDARFMALSLRLAELNDRMRENGYASGQVSLRGCRDRTSESLAAWVHSARCEESFRERWEGASMVVIPVGDETLDVGSYYGDPLVGLASLSRSGR